MIGITGANLTGLVFRKYTLKIIGNTIAGVFGSILLIKSFGRLGFDPKAIMQSGSVDYSLFVLNALVSFCGGVVAVILLSKVRTRVNRNIE